MSLQSNLLGGIQNAAVNKATDLISGVRQKEPNANQQNTGGLQQFITEISSNNGLFRPTFFEVIFTGNAFENGLDKSLSLLCHTASIPGYTLDTTNATIYGLPYEVPTGIQFDPFFCTCYVDNKFKVPLAAYEDLNYRINSDNWSPKYRGSEFTSADDSNLFKVEISAFTIDLSKTESKITADGQPKVATYTLHNAFIKQVQQLALDWGSHDAVSSVTFQISYEWMESDIPNTTRARPLTSKNPPDVVPTNFETVMAKYPALAIAYDATKRTIINNPAIMNNPLLNQGTQSLP